MKKNKSIPGNNQNKVLYLVPVSCVRIAVVLFLCTSFSINLPAQQQATAKKKELDELKLNLNEDGSHFIRFIVLGQLWLRYNKSNPGTTVLKEPANSSFDIGIRRLRFQLFGQLTDHSFFYLHFGQDNFNFLAQRKFTPFIQDAYVEYKVKKGSEALIFGGGLSILSGLSRFSQPQLGSIMTTDLPIFALPTFDLTDQGGRRLSVFARGQAGKLDYRVAISNPSPIKTSSAVLPALSPNGYPLSVNADFAQQGNHLIYQGLFIWNFLEKEPHVLPFMPGTYYGKKKVLNLEGGFATQKNATWSSADGGQTVNYHNLNCWSLAVFYDVPLRKEKGDALNLYIGYFNTQYGAGYMRYIGAMNPADGPGASTNFFPGSQGNAFPAYGNGRVIYLQAGYLLQQDLLGKNNGTLMPYASMQTANYDRLDKQMTLFNAGVNWFLSNNTSKLSFDYQNRPVYAFAGDKLFRSASRKGQLVLQYQFFF